MEYYCLVKNRYIKLCEHMEGGGIKDIICRYTGTFCGDKNKSVPSEPVSIGTSTLSESEYSKDDSSPQVSYTNPYEEYNNCTAIGSGSHGKAMKCTKGGSQYAIKENDNVEGVLREASILKILEPFCSDYILCVKGVYVFNNKGYIVTEFLDGYVTLRDFIKDNDITHEIIMNTVKKLFAGIELIHNSRVRHRDIKPENVMVKKSDNNINIKYIDFGSGCHDGRNIIYKEAPECGKSGISGMTLLYISPTYKTDDSEQSDLWALGITLMDLFFNVDIRFTGTLLLYRIKNMTVDDLFSLKFISNHFSNVCSFEVIRNIILSWNSNEPIANPQGKLDYVNKLLAIKTSSTRIGRIFMNEFEDVFVDIIGYKPITCDLVQGMLNFESGTYRNTRNKSIITKNGEYTLDEPAKMVVEKYIIPLLNVSGARIVPTII